MRPELKRCLNFRIVIRESGERPRKQHEISDGRVAPAVVAGLWPNVTRLEINDVLAPGADRLLDGVVGIRVVVEPFDAEHLSLALARAAPIPTHVRKVRSSAVFGQKTLMDLRIGPEACLGHQNAQMNAKPLCRFP